mmetsp:Transcript_2425/g.7250  ORF Transcript_2425/g.7250 Transcript_2425/m.7250 type:complete len:436 (-) Transcript_2425:599-1906(-)|eukprot:CAMPEP_0198730606 /NCGR_PEP_ID=MMETSP1475-20131203/25248_1 /TAXON_ID= ORGANISM="Unidentified sp., Strain CCMP1999" /NCGR_SAMPLE_ID=MMETSP1475 /ASSEMBLY_ACC=CAM_ASM_001111 /LENGTH=435 /DNA_ID=CAMNT_0044493427 /DNA_START=66 /DNA_END=1373 /DNA_ORIENTATION=+
MSGRNEPPVSKRFELKAEEELRIEATEGADVKLVLLSGDAEILGIELALNKTYNISNRKLPIFSWHGCSISVTGPTDIAYTASETPMPSYVNAFSVLHYKRLAAAKALEEAKKRPDEVDPKSIRGPRVLIVGPPDSGKSSIASLMLNYSIKTAGKILSVDLDVTRNSIGIPGSLAASIASKVDVEEGPLYEAPLCYFYGHINPSESLKRLEELVSLLGESLEAVFNNSEELRTRGYIALVGGWVEDCNREFVGAMVKSMNADCVFVIGSERMYADVTRVVQKESNVEVVTLKRSGGVVRRDAATRRRDIIKGFRNYFYGSTAELNPFSTVVNIDSISVIRIGGGPVVPLTALPIGAEPTLDPHGITHVPVEMDLVHSILAVSQATTEEEVAKAPVKGFVHVAKVDLERRQLVLLAPSPGQIPAKYLIVGTLKWVE